MADDIRDRVAEDLAALMPFYHKTIIKSGQGTSGIQIAQYRVLGVLSRYGTLSISEIGKRLFISKPYMTILIDTLIEEGYAERLPDSHDRRIIRIAITQTGKRHFRQGGLLFKTAFKASLSELDEADLERLHASINSVRQILEKIT